MVITRPTSDRHDLHSTIYSLKSVKDSWQATNRTDTDKNRVPILLNWSVHDMLQLIANKAHILNVAEILLLA